MIWKLERGRGPLLAFAIHAGHAVRAELEPWLALSEADRLREEDPYTDRWTGVAPTRVIALRSRFEVDLNRPREKAVYRTPEDSWGLRVWREEPPEELIARSLAEYDAFYAAVGELLDEVAREHERFLVLDLHSYNHRRQGPDGPAADPAGNPGVNVGTGSMDRLRWGHVVDRFLADLGSYPCPGGPLDARENVKFYGANLARWVHARYPEQGCVLAVEFKKTFMDEWTGALDDERADGIQAALAATVPALLEELKRSEPVA